MAENIIDKVIEEFGGIEITYGFCSPLLASSILKKKKPGIAPKLDQHASFEKNKNGEYICSRKGAAVDFKVKNMCMMEVSKWIIKKCSFDRLYFYGKKRPIHVSFGEDNNQYIALMSEVNEKRMPKSLSKEKFLAL